jgi:hypothetical protein
VANADDGSRNSYYDAFVTKIKSDYTGYEFSTFLGGTGDTYGVRAIATDVAGNTYVTGPTNSSNFPVTSGAYQPLPAGGQDAFVTKFSTTGALVYSTFLGGSSGESPGGIAVDASGHAYVAGSTSSTNFPTTPGSYQDAKSAALDVFIAALNDTGTALLYSTYLGGNGDEGAAVALDNTNGAVYVAGTTTSTDFPLAHALQLSFGGIRDAFVARLDSSLSALSFSTYLGGTADDRGQAVAADGAWTTYVIGYTASAADFPLANAAQGSYAGGANDAFAAKINTNLAPAVLDASITGNAIVGQTLTGTYTFADTENDAEGTSTFRWLRDGTTPVGTNLTYAPALVDAGHSMTFEVTPVAATGASPGAAVTSAEVTILAAPVITSASTTDTPFTTGLPGNFNVTATGYPAPVFTKAGALPGGVSLSAAGLLSGTPKSNTGGVYNITITADNGVSPNDTQSFVLTVNQPPAITSANKTTFIVGKKGSFTVKATGFPPPGLLAAGNLPAGVTFDASTGVLSGTPAVRGTFPLTFTASNVLGNATQTFALTVR